MIFGTAILGKCAYRASPVSSDVGGSSLSGSAEVSKSEMGFFCFMISELQNVFWEIEYELSRFACSCR
jgi:hypothetical protein